MPFFFLSYASRDSDGYLDRFYRDLREAVRARTGLELDEVGFRDTSGLEVGSDWRSVLAEKVASARVFVALCSPSYFASSMCGQEWQLFAELATERQADGVDRLPALLPITWIPTPELPDVAQRLQYAHEDLGAVYKEDGLQFLVRLKRHRDDYETFVLRLAQRIVAAGGTGPPPPPAARPDLDTTPSAFLLGTEADQTIRERVEAHALGPAVPASEPGARVRRGPRHVTFVIVAAPLHHIESVRHDTHFHGSDAFEWWPFRPRSGERICVSAQGVASTRDMTSDLALAVGDRSVAELLAEAREGNEVLVLIVDVWTTRLTSYQTALVEYDGHDTRTSPVVVPWNEADVELRASSDDRKADIRYAFPRYSARQDSLFRMDIPTIEQFRTDLEEVLTIAQSRIFRSGDVPARAASAPSIPRPILSPPKEGTIP